MIENRDSAKLADLVNEKNYDDMLSAVSRIFSYHYRADNFIIIENCYEKVKIVFEGRFSGYKECNTHYHDFDHTMDALLAAIRLVDGFNIAESTLSEKLVITLLRAALFHDIGYIQETDDEGTGAKYTKNHVVRSIMFLAKNFEKFDIGKDDLDSINNIIQCTGLTVNLDDIPFASEDEKTAGLMLGTGDLLGQMSDREYLERLLFLYYEFKEAGIPGYNTEFDIIKSTLKFYSEIKKRLDKDYAFTYQYAKYHFENRYNIKTNLYTDSIEKNMNYVQAIVDDNTTNFRQKLKRGHLLENV